MNQAQASAVNSVSVNSNYKSSDVASNFRVICIVLIGRVCMKS